MNAGPVSIFEVGPRDGLQNEPRPIPASRKIALVDALSAAGLSRIEVTSFVSPRAVPQLADAAEVMAGISRRPGTRYAALVPNLKGWEAAEAAGAGMVAVFASASEGFSRANINCTVEESFARFAPVLEAARAAGIPVRGYVSCVTDCPYEGPVAPAAVARVAARLLAMGCAAISLGETIGRAEPEAVDAMLDAVLKEVPADRLAGHFHDTSGRALENVDVGLARGIAEFDAAAGGLGGCPFAPGAAGNLATERLVAHLDAHGRAPDLDRAALARAVALARAIKAGEGGV